MVMVSVNQKLPERIDEVDIAAWLRRVADDRGEADGSLFETALGLIRADVMDAELASRTVRHAFAVGDILLDLKVDNDTVLAAILHDAVHEAGIPLERITEVFGVGVAELVAGVTRMDIIKEYQDLRDVERQGHAQAESLRKMLLAMVDDVRVVLIKLAIRLFSLRQIKDHPDEQRRSFARETMDIFAPLANRLGIWQLKWEMEDLSFRYLEPETYKQIAKSLAERRVDREAFLADLVTTIEEELTEQDVKAEVTSRPKHIYSIWRKMQRKGLDFHDIFDVRAVRILVDKVEECYAALGLVHGRWQHIPAEFDDYVANPKPNLYRSLHTAVVGDDGRPVEIQIRTHEMHQHSEFGVAAHWRYKEGVSRDHAFENKIAWLRQLLEWKDEVADANEFVDHFRSETFEDRVYVFTPQGKIIDLPMGATPLDFAYYVHTDLGHHCRGAKVDGRIVPLTYTLKIGERIEILRSKEGGPSRDWVNVHLGYLCTSRARSKVRHWFKQQDSEHVLSAGRTVLDRELQRLGAADTNLEHLAHERGYKKLDDFVIAIGRGDVTPTQLAEAVGNLLPRDDELQLELPSVSPSRKAAHKDDITIEGVGNLLTQMSKCCKPVPPDAIVGFITRGRGVTIHRRDCSNVLEMVDDERERLIQVEWGESSDQLYSVDVAIYAYDRQGLLRDITGVLSNEKINVTSMQTHSDKSEHTADMTLTLEIADMQQLSRLLSRIGQLPNVIGVKRRT